MDKRMSKLITTTNPVTLKVYRPSEQETDMRVCTGCGCQIDPERLMILPDTTTCPKCSTVQKPRGIMVSAMSKGCGAELTILPDDPEIQRIADRFHRRSR